MVDVLDGPVGSFKTKKYDPHVNELQARLRERKKLGLTHDLSDSDVIEDNDDGDSEDDILNQYRIENQSHRRTDRPSSATKRRSPVSSGLYDSGISLGDTLRPGQGNRFMKTQKTSALSSSPSSQRKSEMPSISSPKDKHGLRQSPVDQLSYEQKEAMIMNRKTPTKELQRQSPVDLQSKPWQPPSYRKVSATTEDEISDSQSTGLSRGRKTPQDPLLESISETPSPRPRKQSPGTERKGSSMPGIDRKSPGLDRKSPGLGRKSPALDRKSPGLDKRSPSAERKSPKPLNLDDPLMSGLGGSPRAKLKTDVFGSSSTMDAALDEDPTAKPRKSRFDRKTPSEKDRFGGRKTPTEKDRFGGRKTPTEKDRFGGRKTPTEQDRFSRKKTTETSFDDKEKSKEKGEKREEPSLMDFLTGGVSGSEKDKKPKKGLFDDEEDESQGQKVKPRRPRPEVRKETDYEPDSFEALLAKKSYQRGTKPQADDSSVCEELEFEPGERKTAHFQTEESQNLRSYSKQRSDKQEAEDAIELVAGEQSLKPIQRPTSAKKTTTTTSTSKVVKPKPRHSLPGTPTPSLTLSETQFNDTKSLRDAIFNEWKRERTNTLKHKTAEEKKKKEEEEKKKRQAEEEKKRENEIAFKTWKEQKEPTIKEKIKEKHIEEKKKKKAEEEAAQKKKDAEKEFLKWKEQNDEKLKEKEREKIREKRRKEQEEKEKKREREKDNESALKVWKSRKEETLKEKAKEEKVKKKQSQRYIDAEKRRQEEEAREKYEKWLNRKDKQKVVEKKVRYSSMESVEDRPAWSPASRTIPHGR